MADARVVQWIGEKYEALRGTFNERTRRLWAASEARSLGHGGAAAVIAATGMTVCHFPPGTSKWNKIEHRMFCHITHNWRGRPLTSYAVIVQLIGGTTTTTGLQIRAELDTRAFVTKEKVTPEQLNRVRLKPAAFHGEWNYTIVPT